MKLDTMGLHKEQAGFALMLGLSMFINFNHNINLTLFECNGSRAGHP
jgi:hypothetical protein